MCTSNISNTTQFEPNSNINYGHSYSTSCVEWLHVLVHKADLDGLAIKADEYAHKIVEEDENNAGWLLLRAETSVIQYWDFLKPAYRF